MKFLSVIGARPQFVKVAPVAKAFAASPGATHDILHTGQHYDDSLSGVFFSQLGIPAPRFNLAVGSASHGAQTGKMLEGIERVLLDERPDWVIVYGDTNSTLAGALAAVKLHIRVAHVEAGLRSFNRAMPEEINRILTDHAADVLFTPNRGAVDQLLKEGIPASKVHDVGDVNYDAARMFGEASRAATSILARLELIERGFVLATIHRAENTDDPRRLAAIVGAFAKLSQEVPIVWPIHPRTRAALTSRGVSFPERVKAIDPLGYLEMTALERAARLVATDSGGVQKEAFFHGVPAITLRDETEWTELVDLGWNEVVPPRSSEQLLDALRAALRRGPGRAATPFGDGHAAEKIVAHLTR